MLYQPLALVAAALIAPSITHALQYATFSAYADSDVCSGTVTQSYDAAPAGECQNTNDNFWSSGSIDIETEGVTVELYYDTGCTNLAKTAASSTCYLNNPQNPIKAIANHPF